METSASCNAASRLVGLVKRALNAKTSNLTSLFSKMGACSGAGVEAVLSGARDDASCGGDTVRKSQPTDGCHLPQVHAGLSL